MWDGIKLKLEEASYFAAQLDAHARQPRTYLFYLSAFLSSARGVTFHIQKQLDTPALDKYQLLRDEMLSDSVAKYFVNLRNLAEKEGYPSVCVSQTVGHRVADGRIVWTSLASAGTVGPGHFAFLDELLQRDLDVIHRTADPVIIRYNWRFLDYPGGAKDVGQACRDFADRLWEFVLKLRTAHDLV